MTPSEIRARLRDLHDRIDTEMDAGCDRQYLLEGTLAALADIIYDLPEED